ncbi:nicotinamide mononucleotide transporter PnuC [Mycobacterium sp. 852013-50091_SCH5140682]|uniref:nicotinamide riboside transporter PnuC n=1 Tax=Mycobacterium sp. 852013-50091_SCH5140682 TaxID=1834109 RepID=UPI0007E9E48E|nr:nicotinamide riboside transporter PnuC [Mycobacterium sp. 852013-50091_SCH5140682]OBC06759.1 nicotinamide mononucleotide transporter PnuC [Mycobacterium sp. 852013-50091_SCH5140682]
MLDWLAQLVQPLNATLFVLGGDAVSWAELLGFVTGGACVALTVRRHIANFPVGIANCVFFLVLFASARLWADAGLQVLYIALGFAGWWQWLYGNAGRTPLMVTRARPDQIGWCIGVVVAATAALTVILRAAHDSAPFLDALTTSLSLVAQWLLNGKYLQTWYFWIAADCIYVPLYLSRDLNLTAAIYVVFLALCLSGLQSWRKVRVA